MLRNARPLLCEAEKSRFLGITGTPGKLIYTVEMTHLQQRLSFIEDAKVPVSTVLLPCSVLLSSGHLSFALSLMYSSVTYTDTYTDEIIFLI